MCADTSGIGSTQTSPRHSSRPSSVQSRNDSVTIQPPEDQDLDLIEVKKEREDNSGKILQKHWVALENTDLNPVALRMAKTLWSFGHSECSRVIPFGPVHLSILTTWSSPFLVFGVYLLIFSCEHWCWRAD